MARLRVIGKRELGLDPVFGRDGWLGTGRIIGL